MARVRSAHVGSNGDLYAYVNHNGRVYRVGKEAFERNGVIDIGNRHNEQPPWMRGIKNVY
jgi:predicted heme/steroid binding protein